MAHNIRISRTREVLSPLQAQHIVILSEQGCTIDCIPCHFREVWHIDLSQETIEALLDWEFELTSDEVSSGEHYIGNAMIPSGIYWEILTLHREDLWFIQRYLFCRWGILLEIQTIDDSISGWEARLPQDAELFAIYPQHVQRPRVGGYHMASLPASPFQEDRQLTALENEPVPQMPPPYSPQPNLNGIIFRHPREVTGIHGTHLPPFYTPDQVPAPPVYEETNPENSGSFLENLFQDQATGAAPRLAQDIPNGRPTYSSIHDDAIASDLTAFAPRTATLLPATSQASASSSSPPIPVRNPARLFRSAPLSGVVSASFVGSPQPTEPTSPVPAGFTEESPPGYEPSQSLREYLTSLLRLGDEGLHRVQMSPREPSVRTRTGPRPELGPVPEIFPPIYFTARDEAPTLIDDLRDVFESWADNGIDASPQTGRVVRPYMNNGSAELIAEVDSYLEWMQEREQLTTPSLTSSSSSLHSVDDTIGNLDTYSYEIIAELRFSSDLITQEVLQGYSNNQNWSPAVVSQVLRETQAARRRQAQLIQLQQGHASRSPSPESAHTLSLQSSSTLSGSQLATLQLRFNDALARLRHAADIVSALEGDSADLPTLSLSPGSQSPRPGHSRNLESEAEMIKFIGAVNSVLGEADLRFDYKSVSDDEE